MKKLQPIYALFLILFLLYAFSSNPPDGNTGAPGDDNCTRCHIPNNSGFEGMVNLRGLPSIIQPNTTYSLSVVTAFTAGNPARSGFQMVVLDDDGNDTGAFSNEGGNSGLISSNGRTYFEHRGALSFGTADSVVWTVDWTAPSTLPTDSLRIYINSIIGNGSGSSGDLMVSNSPSFGFEQAPAEPISIVIESVQDVNCFGDANGAITASASGGDGQLSFIWSNGETTPTINNLVAGTYSLTVTDSAGDSATASATISQPDELQVTVAEQTNIDCNTVVGNATLSLTGGTAPYLFDWSNGETEISANLPAGISTVTITDANQCTIVSTVTIEADTLTPVVTITNPAMLTCLVESIALEASTDLTENVSISWTTVDGNIVMGSSSLTPIVNAPGTYSLTVTNDLTGCASLSSIVVVQDIAMPVVEAGEDRQLDCSNATTTLEGSGSTGDDISYSWTTVDGNILEGGSTLSPTVSAAGTYVLRVTNNTTGCFSSDSVQVIQDEDLPIISTPGDITIGCGEDTLQIVATGSISANIQYLWTSPDGIIIGDATSLSIRILGPGTYTLSATNIVNSCTAMTSFVASMATLPIADAGADGTLDCNNPTIELDGGASVGENLSFVWSTLLGDDIGDGSSMLFVDEGGTYILTVIDTLTGCTATDSVVVTEVDMTALFAASGDADQLTCEQMSITLNATASEGANIVYEWTTENGNIINGENTLMPTIDAPGAYVLTVRDTITGCTATSSINIAQDIAPPIVSAGDSTTLNCDITSIELMGSSDTEFNVIYSWVTEDGNIVGATNIPNPVVNAAGTYNLTVVDTFTNCAASASVSIGQDDMLPNVDAGLAARLNCNNDTLTLNGNGSIGANISLTWTTENGNIISGENTFTPVINAPGIYTFTIIDTLTGCVNIDEVEILEDKVKPLAEAGQALQVLCGTDLLTIDAMASLGDEFTYFWCTEDGNIVSGAEAPSVVIDGAGLFEFIVTNTANGCSNIDTVIVDAVEGITLSLDTMSAGSATVSVQGGTMPFSFLWNTENEDTTATVTGLQAGEYMVTATDANGCTDTLGITLELSTSIDEFDASVSNLQLFPNPTLHQLNIELSFAVSEIGNITIFNPLGQPIWQQDYEGYEFDYQIQVNTWPAGVYWVLFQNSKGARMEQIVVTK